MRGRHPAASRGPLCRLCAASCSLLCASCSGLRRPLTGWWVSWILANSQRQWQALVWPDAPHRPAVPLPQPPSPTRPSSGGRSGLGTLSPVLSTGDSPLPRLLPGAF